MTPASFPLSLYRGDTYRFTFRVWTDSAKTQPADLTGVVPKAEIRNAPSGATIVPLTCTLTLPNSVTVALPAAQSSLVPTKGAWDLQLTFPSGDVQTIVAGPVTVTPDITDSTVAVVARVGPAAFTQGLRAAGGF